MSCLFCQIIAGEIPAPKIYEDGDVFVFLDNKPVNAGHTLVLPKKHASGFHDADPEVLKKLVITMQKIARAMTEALGIEGFNIEQNNGRVAGQVIDHLHFHLIPRSATDGLRHWPGKEYATKEEADTVAEKIRKAIV